MSGLFEDLAHGIEKTSKAIKKGSKVNTTNSRIRKGEIAGPAMPKKVARKIAKKQVSKVADKAWTAPKREAEAKKAWNKKVDRESKKIVKKLQAPKVSEQVDKGGSAFIDLMLGKKKEGFDPTSFQTSGTGRTDMARDALRTGKNVIAETAEDPGDVLGNTVKSVPETLASSLVFPVKAAKLAIDKGPVKAAEEIGKGIKDDYKFRYSQSDAEQKKRFKEQGVLPELLDASIVVSGGGAAAGRLATQLASKGALGKGAKVLVETPRPKLRVSGGITKEQPIHPNIFKAYGQKKLDSKRVAKQAKAVAARDAGKTRISAVRASVKSGEVAPLLERTSKKLQRKSVQEGKSRGVQAMKTKQHEIVGAQEKGLAVLSPLEQKAFKYAQQIGARTPEAGAKALRRRKSQIERVRRETGEKPGPFRTANNDLAVINELLKDPGAAFTPKLAKVANESRRREKRAAALAPSFDAETALGRRYVQQADLLGLPDPRVPIDKAVKGAIRRAEKKGRISKKQAKRLTEEASTGSVAGAVASVRREAKKQGLEDPGYFPSNRFDDPNYSAHALGGTKATAGKKRYEGKTYEAGMEDTRPQVLSDAMAGNVKQFYNWNTVADNLDKHSFDWGRDLGVGQAKRVIEEKGVDPATVMLWAPKKMREKKLRKEADSGEEQTSGQLSEAIDDSIVSLEQLQSDPKAFKNTKFNVIPTAVYKEIHTDTRPSGAAGRSVDIVKQKASRTILGLNPAWALAQPVANAVTAGLAGVGPKSFIDAQRWWRGLKTPERQALEPYLGVGPFQQDVRLTKLGSTADNDIVNAYRGLKQSALYKYRGTRVGQKVGNPLDTLFRFDNAQNNAFRKAVLYKAAKREAYDRMGRNAKAIIDGQEKVLKGGDLASLVLKEPQTVERLAKHVNDFMGDYVTYSARERHTFQRAVMFYGFLRFSLKFTFRTMPENHPLLSSILMQLGHLQAEETKELLGQKGELLPAYAAGKLFNEDGTEAVNIGKINPALNALISAQDPEQLVPSVNPVAKLLYDQVSRRDSFTGKPFAFGGKNWQQIQSDGDKPSVEERGRIALAQVLGMAAPYRAAEKIANPGVQGSDSLLGSPRPTKYRNPETIASIKKSVADEEARGTQRRLLEQLIPFLPQPDHTAQSLNAKPGKKKLKKKTNAGPGAAGAGPGSSGAGPGAMGAGPG